MAVVTHAQITDHIGVSRVNIKDADGSVEVANQNTKGTDEKMTVQTLRGACGVRAQLLF